MNKKLYLQCKLQSAIEQVLCDDRVSLQELTVIDNGKYSLLALDAIAFALSKVCVAFLDGIGLYDLNSPLE